MHLFNYAYCADFERKIAGLAGLCPETWSYGSNNDFSILKNYIEYTFQKLSEEGLVMETEKYSIFNTGLYTEYYEPIYAYFSVNRIPDHQKWFLDGFYSSYSMSMIGITTFPERANYFSDPSALVFNTNCEIIPQYQHIFNDTENLQRIPQSIRDSSNKTLLFDGAIKRAKAMINANYKTAVPQYYKGKIQLLIPICLTNDCVPDLALVVSKNETGTQYMGHTCLTLDMAYGNARLIARPESIWLKP